ncbi:hypothetical protein QTN47_20650 [Danxiaibacter flavus]|uniref:Glycosyltransferase RgtA/B/C/D-like domain-containing protein n=1 Tax=Danxiaibacter flavus TaxID=3049108 RepID=A0ABV3ZK41_9BACT|nr:hypothetical protein QNM32_20655 [Chitinophagaceae bacterium DXS]
MPIPVILMQPRVNTANLIRSQLWKQWAIAATIVVLIYAVTIPFAPYLHPDELLTLDMGRTILNPHKSWSIGWLLDQGQPVLLFTYVGPVLQEFSYWVMGQFGPRISALSGAILAATVMMAWLKNKRIPDNAALLLSLAFLLDPLFVQAYTIGRVDGWAMACSLSACLIISNATNQPAKCAFAKYKLLFAGALTCLSVFVWASAAFLIPLVILELVSFIRSYSKCAEQNNRGKSVLFFVAGGCLMLALLLAPILGWLTREFTDVLSSIVINLKSGQDANKPSFASKTLTSLARLFGILKFTPVIVMAALAGIVYRKSIGLIISMAFAVFLMIETFVYIQRVQYLLPYLIACTALLYQEDESRRSIAPGSKFKSASLIIILIWCTGLSVAARTVLAFNGSETRNRHIISLAAQTFLNRGNYRVFAPYEFYYTGTSLRWRMYSPYIPINDTFTTGILQKLMPHVDYIIVKSETELPDEYLQVLHNNNVYLESTFNPYVVPDAKFDGKTTNITRLRNLYSLFRQPYGPYRFYKRKELSSK